MIVVIHPSPAGPSGPSLCPEPQGCWACLTQGCISVLACESFQQMTKTGGGGGGEGVVGGGAQNLYIVLGKLWWRS